MPPDVRRLHVVTLALEEALEADDWPSVHALLERRDGLIAELEGAVIPTGDSSLLEETRKVEQRLLGRLLAGRRDIIGQMGDARKERQMVRAYKSA